MHQLHNQMWTNSVNSRVKILHVAISPIDNSASIGICVCSSAALW